MATWPACTQYHRVPDTAGESGGSSIGTNSAAIAVEAYQGRRPGTS